MGTAIVRCPNCGSVSNRTEAVDEYVCSHCNARFKFIRPGDQVLTHDVRAHNCPICGDRLHRLMWIGDGDPPDGSKFVSTADCWLSYG